MSGRDTQLNFSAINDILSCCSREYFNADFSSVALEEVGLRLHEFSKTIALTATALPVCPQGSLELPVSNLLA